jgi:hypothetical protein
MGSPWTDKCVDTSSLFLVNSNFFAHVSTINKEVTRLACCLGIFTTGSGPTGVLVRIWHFRNRSYG